MPTASPTPSPAPSLTLLAPVNGQGPVGAHLTLSGANFPGAQIGLAIAKTADCKNTTQVSDASGAPLAIPLVSGAFSNFSFVWPATSSLGYWYLCAPGMHAGAPSYRVLSSNPPQLALSNPDAKVGQQVTITGSNFYGPPDGSLISLSVTAPAGGPLTIGPAVLSNGSFSYPWTVSGAPVGPLVIKAFSQPDVAAADPVLQASIPLTIDGQVTPTVTITPTVVPKPALTSSTHSPVNLAVIDGIVTAIGVVIGLVGFIKPIISRVIDMLKTQGKTDANWLEALAGKTAKTPQELVSLLALIVAGVIMTVTSTGLLSPLSESQTYVLLRQALTLFGVVVIGGFAFTLSFKLVDALKNRADKQLTVAGPQSKIPVVDRIRNISPWKSASWRSYARTDAFRVDGQEYESTAVAQIGWFRYWIDFRVTHQGQPVPHSPPRTSVSTFGEKVQVPVSAGNAICELTAEVGGNTDLKLTLTVGDKQIFKEKW